MENIGFAIAAFATVPGAIVVTVLISGHKLKKKALEMGGGAPQLGPELDALRDYLNDTRAQLAEMQERLDFTERLLGDGRASQEDPSA